MNEMDKIQFLKLFYIGHFLNNSPSDMSDETLSLQKLSI